MVVDARDVSFKKAQKYWGFLIKVACTAGGRQSCNMNRSEVLRQIFELGSAGGALPSDEALRVVATMIDRLDANSDSFELDVVALMRVGATICAVSRGGQDVCDAGWPHVPSPRQ